MKRRKLKKWVVWLLTGIGTIAFLVMASECTSTWLFIVSKIVSAIVFSLCSYVVLKEVQNETK